MYSYFLLSISKDYNKMVAQLNDIKEHLNLNITSRSDRTASTLVSIG